MDVSSFSEDNGQPVIAMANLELLNSDGNSSENTKMIPNLPYQEEAIAVDAAVQNALSLVQYYSERDDSDPVWKNPDDVYQKLDAARTTISQAWQALDDSIQADAAANSSTTSQLAPSKDQLRAAYMDMITDAFADVLDNMRQKCAENEAQDPLDVNVLVDCLQSGLDLFYMNGALQVTSEADFLWNTSNNDDDDDEFLDDTEYDNEDNDDGMLRLTPHERRRRELGYLHHHPEEATSSA